MDINNLKSYDKFIVNNSNKKNINISVYLVSKRSFNDERLIEANHFIVDDIKNKPLIWFDLYLGKKMKNTSKIAFLYLDDTDLYFFVDDGNDIKIAKTNNYSYIFSDDYDDSYIISTHIW